MTDKPKFKGTIIVCVRCKRERPKNGNQEVCKSCYGYLRKLERYKDAPLKKCEHSPECQVMIRAWDRCGTPKRYALGHQGFLRSGKKSPSFKNGFMDLPQGYRYQLFHGHPFCNSVGYIMFHRIVYEMYHKCCLLPWADIHHRDGNVRRNHPENLQGMLSTTHKSITHKGVKHKKKRYRRKCIECGSKTTARRKNGTWKWYEVSPRRFRCDKCYRTDPENWKKKLEWQRQYRKKRKRLVISI